MIIAIVAVLLGIVGLIWFWKVPLKRLIKSLKESGSSPFEAYAIAAFLSAGIAFAVYMIAQVI